MILVLEFALENATGRVEREIDHRAPQLIDRLVVRTDLSRSELKKLGLSRSELKKLGLEDEKITDEDIRKLLDLERN